MSETAKIRAQAKAQEVDARAAAWIDRRDKDGWSAEDQAALDAWLDEDPVHRITFWRMDAAWEHTPRLAALQLRANAPAKSSSHFRIAAVLAIVAATAAAFWPYLDKPKGETYTTSIGGRESIMLADGTQIELNTNSAVRVLDTTRERKVWLQKGEAYLQVTHDAKRPLTVYAGGRRITDLGTKFDVREEMGRLEVAVVEGSVRLGAEDRDARAVVLTKGQVAVATGTRISTTRRSTRELATALSWRSGVLVFDNTPLSAAVAQLNRYNRTKLAVADEETGRLAITGTLSATDPVEFLRMAQTVLGVHARSMNGLTVISK